MEVLKNAVAALLQVIGYTSYEAPGPRGLYMHPLGVPRCSEPLSIPYLLHPFVLLSRWVVGVPCMGTQGWTANNL